eukprot:gb/GECG01013658.1/.p1 GENE.gb/GECG01013658.1/~~gb/GECG01013658.1/.p1  ORF type:complete len:1187 (+),score=123.57 gb/GECG01013658.1/:1-3561(+)
MQVHTGAMQPPQNGGGGNTSGTHRSYSNGTHASEDVLSLETTKEYVIALQNPQNDRSSHKAIDRKLRNFRKKTQAWEVAVTLVQTPSGTPHRGELAHFGATTLVDKIRHDFTSQLSYQQQVQLRDTLLSLVYTLFQEVNQQQQHSNISAAEHMGMRSTFKQLGLALAALSVRLEGWDDFISSIISVFSSGQDNQSSNKLQVGDTVLPLPSMRVIPCILVVLQEVPDEAHLMMRKRAVGKNKTERVQSVLDKSAAGILSLLDYAIRSVDDPKNPVTQSVLLCFKSWVRKAPPPSAAVAESPVLEYAFMVLRDQHDAFDTALDVFVEVVASYNSTDRDVSVMRKVIPKVMELQSTLNRAIAEDDIDLVTDMTRLYASVGEEYVLWLLRDDGDMPGSFLHIILTCTSVNDLDVSRTTIPFWFRLMEEYKDLGNDQSQLAVQHRLASPLKRLVTVLTNVIQFPVEFSSWTADKQSEFKHEFRYDISDLYLDLCCILGSSVVLEILAERLDSQLNSFRSTGGAGKIDRQTNLPVGTWQGVEATMYAIRSIGRYVPADESRVLPVLMKRETLEMFPGKPEMRATIFRLVGRYAFWLREQAVQGNRKPLDDLLSLLQELFSAIVSRNPFVIEATYLATALANICDKCSSILGADKCAQLTKLLQGIPGHLAVELLPGLTIAALCFDSETEVEHCLHALVQPSIAWLRNFSSDPKQASTRAMEQYQSRIQQQQEARTLSEGSQETDVRIKSEAGNNSETAASEGLVEVLQQLKTIIEEIGKSKKFERLGHALPRSGQRTHPVVSILHHLWDDLDRVGQMFAANFSVSEALCSLYKHSLRSCRLAFAPLVEKLVAVILDRISSGCKRTTHNWQMIIEAHRDTLSSADRLLDESTTESLMETSVQSSYVYLASVLITIFNRIADAKQHLVSLTTDITRSVEIVFPFEPFPPNLARSAAELMPSDSIMRSICRFAGSDSSGIPRDQPSAIGFPLASCEPVREASVNALAVRLNSNPELTEDWFKLAEHALHAFPTEFLNSTAASVALQLCFGGLKCQQSLVTRAVFSFLLRALRLGMEISNTQTRLKDAYEAHFSNNLLILSDRLMAAAAGALPISRVDDPQGNISEVVFAMMELIGNRKYAEMFELSLNAGTIPQSALDQNQLQECYNELLHASYVEDVVHALREIAKACDDFRDS